MDKTFLRALLAAGTTALTLTAPPAFATDYTQCAANNCPDPAPKTEQESPINGWAWYTGPVVSGGTRYAEVDQGWLGDCWFAASVAAATRHHYKNFPAKNITVNGDGTVTYDFYEWSVLGGYQPKPVRVDRELWTSKIGPDTGWTPIYGSSDYGPSSYNALSQMELWWPLYEKAFARYKGNYGAIDTNTIEYAFKVLHGKDPQTWGCNFSSSEDVWKEVSHNFKGGMPVAFSTPPDAAANIFKYLGGNYEGWTTGHAYAVVGINESNQTIDVYDPNSGQVATVTPTQLKQACQVIVYYERPKLDVAFVIDTTGSMWDDLYMVSSTVDSTLDALYGTGPAATSAAASLTTSTGDAPGKIIPDVRASVVDYKDHPIYPYGDSSDYPYLVRAPFTRDPNTIRQAVYSLSAGGGNNWPESVNYALARSIAGEGLADADGTWRVGAKKSIILLGDAPPNNPDPVSGTTLSMVTLNAEAADPIEIYPILVGNWWGYDPAAYFAFQQYAQGTGGQLFMAGNAYQVSSAILAALDTINDDVGSEPDPVVNQPPVCSGASASISSLWPVNNKLVPVQLGGVSDPEGGAVTLAITGITQDEPVYENGRGASAEADASGVGSAIAMLRAERTGSRDGRVYRVAFRGTDAQGASCTGQVLVCVPHDKADNTACHDDGGNYNSTQGR